MSESTEVVTAPTETQASRQKARMDALVSAIEGRSAQLKTLLQESGIPFNRFVEVFRRALIKGANDPRTDLLLADAGSVVQSCIDSCTAGLLPDGKQGAIVIFNQNVAARGQPKRYVKKAQFLAMYEGLLHTAYSSGNFTSIMAHVVYETDEWDYELGINPWIKHKPGKRPPRPDGAPEYEIKAAYAVAKTVNGGVFVEVFEPEDIRKVMAVSKATFGPAKDWKEAMIRKGPLRRLYKFLPRNDAMDRVFAAEDENLEIEEPELEPERKLTPGFRPAALAAPTDEPMAHEMPAMEPESIHVEADVSEIPGNLNTFEPEAESEPEFAQAIEPAPWAQAFDDSLSGCTSWLNIKQRLKTLMKDAIWENAGVSTYALVSAWRRFKDVGDKTDFVTDPLLFGCWLVAAEPDPDSAEANWRILTGTEAYTKADEPLKGLLGGLYAAAVEEPAP